MSNKLRAIGYWRSDRDQHFPEPQGFVGVYEDKEFQNKIVRYLNSGISYVDWRGLSWCRFNCDVDARHMGNKDLTDGYWIWPEGLSHYVSKHDVVLPADFVEYMGSKNWQCPASIEIPFHRENYDFQFWKKIT